MTVCAMTAQRNLHFRQLQLSSHIFQVITLISRSVWESNIKPVLVNYLPAHSGRIEPEVVYTSLQRLRVHQEKVILQYGTQDIMSPYVRNKVGTKCWIATLYNREREE
jgi:hypothetical protein